MVRCICPQCHCAFESSAGRYNRAVKIGAPMFCSRACSGLARRLKNPPSESEKKEAKRAYDKQRLLIHGDRLREEKRAFYYANRERLMAVQAEYRKKNMHKHVDYCRRPEYRKYKADYDQRYRANKIFGEFSDAFLVLLDVEKTIDQQATPYERRLVNGTINKAQKRRRAL